MKNNKTRYICEGALIAVLYIVLTYISALFNLSSGVIQLRLSEALCILPIFTPAAIPGLAIGCLLSNLFTGSIIIDIIFGSIATLIGAIFTRLLRRHTIPSLLSPILSNTVIIPIILKYAYHADDAYWFIVITVFAGEFISAGILGYILRRALRARKLNKLFPGSDI